MKIPLVCLSFLVLTHGYGASHEDRVKVLKEFATQPQDYWLGEPLHRSQVVAAFFRDRQFLPVWLDEKGAWGADADALLTEIRESTRHGLIPAEYHLKQLESMKFEGEALTADQIGAVEIFLTDAFLALGQHLSSGRVAPKSINAGWTVRRNLPDMKKQLEMALGGPGVSDTFTLLTPTNSLYRSLRTVLETYQRLAAQAPFPVIENGPTLKPGGKDKRVPFLRQRMMREGYLIGKPATGERYDRQLKEAVLGFQTTHGLKGEGTLGNDTVAELNVPMETRVRQVKANLERLRWLPQPLGIRYVFVDIADFRLTVMDEEEPKISMRIIVGEDFRETPIFSARIKSIVLNPTWVVPESIVREELLPKLVLDRTYIRKKGIRAYKVDKGRRIEVPPETVDWAALGEGPIPYVLEEEPGPKNPLGAIKFVFPNEHSVYLHGTPDVSLFDRQRRTLSHGCVRVENPLALASYLLNEEPLQWPEALIRKTIGSREQVSITAATPIPVHLVYRTAWMDAKRRIQFRRDIYGWDESLANALEVEARGLAGVEN